MGIEKLNEYRLDFEDNHSEIFMAKNTRSAVNVKETDLMPVVQVTRLKTGIGVETPIRNVKFTVIVLPEPAADNGCKGTPETWIVPEDTNVIFTALPCTGYQFDGWFDEGGSTAISTDEVAEFPVPYPSDPAALSKIFEARFSPVP